MEAVTDEDKRIAAAQRGDMEAFEALVRDHQPSVLLTAYHLMGNEADADDVTQNTWLRVWRALPRFQFRSRFSTWLYRIAVNESMSALKRRKRRLGFRKRDVALDAGDGEYPLRDRAPNARAILEGKEAGRAFQRSLDALPVRQKLAVTLVLLQGLSHREAGEIIGVAEKTVSWHLFKARKRLLGALKDVL